MELHLTLSYLKRWLVKTQKLLIQGLFHFHTHNGIKNLQPEKLILYLFLDTTPTQICPPWRADLSSWTAGLGSALEGPPWPWELIKADKSINELQSDQRAAAWPGWWEM